MKGQSGLEKPWAGVAGGKFHIKTLGKQWAIPSKNSSDSEKMGRLPFAAVDDLCCPQILTSNWAVLCRNEPLYLQE